MSESFSVGEIATLSICDYHRPLGLSDGMEKYLNTEVTVKSRARPIYGQRVPHHIVCAAIDGSDFDAAPCCLRKRRPPQDPAYVKFRDSLGRQELWLEGALKEITKEIAL